MSKQHFAFITVILTYLLIVFGGYVASSESGMGCGPDWPLCNGEVIPQLEGDTLIEFGHRVIGALLFIMTILLFNKIKKSYNSLLEIKLANWALVLLSLQLIMGAIVVFYHLPSIIITIHLLIAMIFMGQLIWFWRHDSKQVFVRHNTYIVRHLNKIIILLFMTIGLGAYIKHEQLGLACGWLGCTPDSFLPLSFPQLLQTSHRLLAIVVTVYIIFYAYKVLKTGEQKLFKRMLLILLVTIIQIVAGVLTILSLISLSMALLHLAIGTLLFAMVVEARIIID